MNVGQDLVFGIGMNGVLKIMIQQKSSPEDILEVDGFKGRWAECIKARADEIVAERAMSQMAEGAEPEEEEEENPLVRPALAKSPANCVANSKEYWDAFAAEQVRQYVRLSTEPSSQAALVQEIKQSALNVDLRGEPNKSTVMIILEVDNLMAAVSRPWDRKPPANQGVINKLVPAALSARGGLRYEVPESQAAEAVCNRFVAPCDQDILILCDGGRDHLRNILLAP